MLCCSYPSQRNCSIKLLYQIANKIQINQHKAFTRSVIKRLLCIVVHILLNESAQLNFYNKEPENFALGYPIEAIADGILNKEPDSCNR